MAGELGGTGEVEVLVHSFTFTSAAMTTARLEPPPSGSRAPLSLRAGLEVAGKPELYDEVLATLGLAGADRTMATRYLDEATRAFDAAAALKPLPHPFGHRIRPHLRPYIAGSCERLIAEGHYPEALWWLAPFYLAATDLITMDGLTARHRVFERRAKEFLEALGLGTREERANAFLRAGRIHDQVFALATLLAAKRGDEPPAPLTA
jgi:hypothetical protein